MKKRMLKTNSISTTLRVSLIAKIMYDPPRINFAGHPVLCCLAQQLIMFGKILDTASLLKAKIAKDELDQALIEATNDDNWQASTTILHEIASSAYNHQKWKRISEFLWERLKNSSRWKKVLKALNIVEFLLKNGPGFAVDEFRRELFFFRTQQSFQAYEDNIDRGAPIRERAKAVVSLLSNEDLLEDERVRARQIRERMSHLNGTANLPPGRSQGSTGPKYESYNSETFGKGGAGDNNAFYNYGHGNYGDREYDRNHRDDYFQHAGRKIQSPKKQQKQPPKVKESIENNPKPVQSTPIITAPKRQQKGNYETMAQRLMRSKPLSKVEPKTQESAPVVPDLSYKKKDVEDLLIDTEAHFVESRYHLDAPVNQTPQSQRQLQPQTQPTYSPPVQTQPMPTPIVQNNYTPASTTNNTSSPLPVSVPSPAPAPSQLTQMDGLLFLGVQPSEQPKNTQSQNCPPIPQAQTSPTQQATNIFPATQTIPQTPSIPPYQQQPQIQQPFQPSIVPQPAYQPIIQPPIQPNYGYSQPAYSQGLQYPPNNMYPPAFGGYYGSPQMPVYQQSPYTAYPQNGYPTISPSNPYAPPYNPQSLYTQSPYQTPNYQPSFPSYPTAPNISNTLTFSPVVSTTLISTSPSPPVPAQSAKKNAEDEFGDFKNGGSFEIQKIGWLSNKEKNLTDLTDFSIDPKDRRKPQQKKKQFGNNIKIDPWAW